MNGEAPDGFYPSWARVYFAPDRAPRIEIEEHSIRVLFFFTWNMFFFSPSVDEGISEEGAGESSLESSRAIHLCAVLRGSPGGAARS
jgi:hypothetical protein